MTNNVREYTMKMYNMLFTLLILMVLQPLAAGDSDDGPLAESRVLRDGGGDEIIGVFTDSNNPLVDRRIVVSKYFLPDKDTPSGAFLDVLTFLMPGSAPYYGLEDPYNFDLITINNDNELSDIVAAWIDFDFRLQLVALRADPNRLSNVDLAEWEKERRRTAPHPSLPPQDGVSSRVRLASGDITGDGTEEFVLSYGPYLSLGLYKINDNLDIMPNSTLHIPYISPPTIGDWGTDARFTFYDITTGDLNGDGKDEILLVGRAAGESGGWNLLASVFSYDPGDNRLVGILIDTLLTVTDDLSYLTNVNVIIGYLNSEDSQQAIVNYSLLNLTEENISESIDLYMVALDFDESLSQITQSAPYHQIIGDPAWYHDTRLALKSADINGDGFEEIFSAYSNPSETYFRVDQLSDGIEFIEYANLDSLIYVLGGQFGINDFGFGNVIPDTTGVKRSPELIISYKDDYQHGPCIIYTINTDESGFFQGVTLAAINYSEPISTITTADLDGDIRLGPPKRSRITDIVQPLVILNAPPTHFDIFDGQSYDLNIIFGEDGSPRFFSRYEESKEQKIEMQTEFHKDWGVSAKISAGGGIKGFSVSGHLEAKYGEQFRESGGTSETFSVSVQTDAIVDDMIYAAIVDYELWEYPVLANGIERGHILVVEPGWTGRAWFPSKSWTGYSYVPNHEVGNILSYREYPELTDNPMLDKKIMGDYNIFFVLGQYTNYTWGLKWEHVEKEEEIQSHDYSVEIGAEVSKWGVTVAVDGRYAVGEINTQRSEIREGLSVDVRLGRLRWVGEVGYRVIPYTYWADNGALVLDYAVKLELPPPGYTETWWDVHYGKKPDPAFILPWRYDPEKGLPLQDPVKRHQTKDITFFPESPSEGDLVTITARIHNFSLLPTPSPVGVSFYVGDPDDGGTLIVGEGNKTIVYTDGTIPDRGRKEVQMDWTVPANIGSFPRIYALIDPDQQIDEIHDNNNKGWNVLGKQPFVGIEENIVGLPSEYTLYQNYPNPFNPGTTFEFSIPKSGMVTLEVYNVLGQKVATLVSEELFAGNHSYYWDAGWLASGVYIYRLQAGEFVESKKLLFLK